MPRRKRDASTDAAAEAFRHRLSRHVGPGTSDEAPPGARGEALLTFAEPDSEGPGEESAPPSRIRFRTSRRVALPGCRRLPDVARRADVAGLGRTDHQHAP
ncbi:hypothetical protein AAHB34_11010 [Paenarthrobacter ureafaciens]